MIREESSAQICHCLTKQDWLYSHFLDQDIGPEKVAERTELSKKR